MSRWFRGLVDAVGLLGLACWIGGLAFYGGAIRPLLQERIGITITTAITKRVTTDLNLLGLAVLALLWLGAWLAGRAGDRRARRWPLVPLVASTTLLIALFGVHAVLARRMEVGQTHSAGFFPMHQVYLAVSLLQWLTNVGLLLSRHRPDDRSDGRDPSSIRAARSTNSGLDWSRSPPIG